MRQILPLFIIAFILTGCNLAGGVGVGTGGGTIGVGAGGGGVTVGAATGSGMGVAFSSYGDFLYSGNGKAYSNNKKGLREFLDKNYIEAQKTFEKTLSDYPANPDAMYYLGLTLIFLDDRDAGYSLLIHYRDPFKTRVTQEVKWWANYCQKKPELTAEKIYHVMNKARGEGYKRDQEEYWEDRR